MCPRLGSIRQNQQLVLTGHSRTCELDWNSLLKTDKMVPASLPRHLWLLNSLGKSFEVTATAVENHL